MSPAPDHQTRNDQADNDLAGNDLAGNDLAGNDLAGNDLAGTDRASNDLAGVGLRAPLLGEWACLGIFCEGPAHGWAIVTRLRGDGDIGRIWHLSRPLTYRAIEQLTRRDWVRAVGEEAGNSGPNRTILAATDAGRAQFRDWLDTPVEHLRDIRSELLLKIVFARILDIDIDPMLDRQRAVIDRQVRLPDTDGTEGAAGAVGTADVVALWRREVAHAAQRFIDQIHPTDTCG